MSRGREVIDRKDRNNGVTNRSRLSETEREREKERGTGLLFVVLDEMKKEQTMYKL